MTQSIPTMPAAAAPVITGGSLTMAAAALVAALLMYALLRRNRSGVEPVLERLTYREVVGWFVEHRPAQGNANRAALIRQMIGRQFRVNWCFLDADGSVCCDGRGDPLGRSAWVRSFDDELQRLFGENDVIVFE